MFFKRLVTVSDCLPSAQADAVCCLSYCLNTDGSDLTQASRLCAQKGIELIKKDYARQIIFSNCYTTWQKELAIKLKMAGTEGTIQDRITFLAGIASSYEEANHIKRILDDMGARTLILVADGWHMKRALDIFSREMSKIRIFRQSVWPEKYERTLEPSLIKSIRFSYRPLWIAWNIIFYFLTPLLVRNQRPQPAHQ